MMRFGTMRSSTGPRNWSFVYDANDERVGRWDRSTLQWKWTLRGLGNEVLREATSSGGTTGTSSWSWGTDYVYRSGALLASDRPDGRRYYHLDHLGTPRLVTDSFGNGVTYKYAPFGTELTSVYPDAETRKFTGHERDATSTASSLDYMHARYYASNFGRFLSVDPVLNTDRALHNPQAWNRYAYVENNPINKTDPTGKFCIPCLGGLIGGAIGVGVEGYRQSHDVIVHGIPANNQRLIAAALGGAASGAIGASCVGCKLIMSTGAGLAGTTIGGVIGRASDGQHSAAQVFDGVAMLKDGRAGAIGGVVGYGVAAGTLEPMVAANKLGESAAREFATQNNLGLGFFEIVKRQELVKELTRLSVGAATAFGEATSAATARTIPEDDKLRPRQ